MVVVVFGIVIDVLDVLAKKIHIQSQSLVTLLGLVVFVRVILMDVHDVLVKTPGLYQVLELYFSTLMLCCSSVNQSVSQP